ncbi:diacylglycerol kinase family protein [Thalassolituus sp. C2-1]|nr:diacylglycerol kinase family protein [Thalassolituus sp. C2-1]
MWAAMIRWLVRRRQSFGYAFSGLVYMLRTQPHAQVHLLAVVVVVSAGCLTGLAPTEWVVLILSMALVLSLEAMNTALEALADALHPSHHPLVGKAKDLAAAAVLVSALASVIIGTLIFIPHWLS